MSRNLDKVDLRERCLDYKRVIKALSWLNDNFESQPSLQQVAAHIGLSQAHFQRLFSRWVGVSPKRYVQYLTIEEAKRCLRESQTVLDAALSSGLSGPGRLHDLFVQLESLSPGEYKTRGKGLRIRHGITPSHFGDCLILTSERGICGLAFIDAQPLEQVFSVLSAPFASAHFVADQAHIASLGQRIFGSDGRLDQPLKVLVKGTEFQLKVWRALLEIPTGQLISYAQLARRVGHPGAVRAAGSANAINAVSYLIPCHRVIRSTGRLGHYRWGAERKLAILTRESIRVGALPADLAT